MVNFSMAKQAGDCTIEGRASKWLFYRIFKITKIQNLHRWNLTPLQARQLQEKLSGRIFAAAVVFSFPQLERVETVPAELPLVFPYVPGLLSFREIPVCLEAVKQINQAVDVWLVDGQGIAHPRRIGLASHLGLFLNTPPLGCAKSRLIGTYTEPKPEKGSFSWLYDKGEKISAVVRTRTGVKPLFVSPGHLCSFEDAIYYTLACTTKVRLPEPTRIAHRTVAKVKS